MNKYRDFKEQVLNEGVVSKRTLMFHPKKLTKQIDELSTGISQEIDWQSDDNGESIKTLGDISSHLSDLQKLTKKLEKVYKA